MNDDRQRYRHRGSAMRLWAILVAAPFVLATQGAAAQFDADGRVTVDLSVIEDGGYNRPRATAPGAPAGRRTGPATAAAPTSQFYGLPGLQTPEATPPRAEPPRRQTQPQPQPQRTEKLAKKADAPPAKAAPATATPKRENAPLPPPATQVPAPPVVAEVPAPRPSSTTPATRPTSAPPSPSAAAPAAPAVPAQTLAAPIVPAQAIGGPSSPSPQQQTAAIVPPPPPPPPAAPAAPAAAPAAKPAAPAAAPASPQAKPGAKPTEQAARPPAEMQGRVLQIRFTGEDVRISQDGQNGLKALAEKIKDNDAIRLQLTAYAGGDQVTDSKARRLSLSRALAVRTYLIEQGVRSTRVEVRALGDKVPDEPLNRVDVTIADR